MAALEAAGAGLGLRSLRAAGEPLRLSSLSLSRLGERLLLSRLGERLLSRLGERLALRRRGLRERDFDFDFERGDLDLRGVLDRRGDLDRRADLDLLLLRERDLEALQRTTRIFST